MADKFVLRELSRYPLGTFADIIYRNALLRADEEAFVCGAQRITFARFNSRVNRLVRALQASGIKKGDVIGILAWNGIEYPDFYGAAMKGGFIAAPFNPRLHVQELEYLINYSEARALFVGPELLPVLPDLRLRLPGVKVFISFQQPFPEMVYYDDLISAVPTDEEPDIHVDRNDPVILLFTSGTTGLPRGALYTHAKKLDNTRIKALEMGVKPGDRHLMILPFFHIGGDSHVWPFFIVGGSNVILPQKSFDPQVVLQAIEEEKVTDMQIVPTQLHALLSLADSQQKVNLSSLRRIYYAASPMPLALLRRGIEKFGCIFAQGYGQTESGPQICSLPRNAHQVLDRPEEEQKVLGSCGQPSLGVHVRIVDEKGDDVAPGNIGEILAQSDSIMLEYWRRPKETGETLVDGWLHTGDLAYYDSNGFITIVDRKKDMIVSGGENVYSREVEEVLHKHPEVVEVAVIGVPDPVWVERVHAVIALRPGSALTAQQVIAYCKSNLASYKAPKSVEFIDVLPKSAQGKILKRTLREKYQAPDSNRKP